jgi:hypothetical protein
MEPDEYDKFEKLNRQQPTFEILDKSELNIDEDEEMKLWDNTLLDGLDDM